MLPPSPDFWFHLHLYSGQKCVEPFGFKAHLSPGGWIQHGIGEKWQCREGSEGQPLPPPVAPGVERKESGWHTGEFPACALPLGFLQLPAGRAELLWIGFSGSWEQTKMLSSKHSPKERENSRFKLDTIFLLLEDPVILANTLLNNIVKIVIPAFHILCQLQH